MPQHDGVIADGDGASVLADINAALVAIFSGHKGPTPPSGAVAGMRWIDDNTPSTTVWTLNQYDGSNWIPIGEIDTTNDRFTVSGSAVGKALLWATTAEAARNAILAQARSQGAAGVGQFVPLTFAGGVDVVAPAGGTWEYFLIQRRWADKTVENAGAGIVAGGTTVVAGNTALDHFGYWRRVT